MKSLKHRRLHKQSFITAYQTLRAKQVIIQSVGVLYYGRDVLSSYDFYLVAMETKQTNP
jgi:hypothetical protein